MGKKKKEEFEEDCIKYVNVFNWGAITAAAGKTAMTMHCQSTVPDS